MSRMSQPGNQTRGNRVKLLGSVLAIVQVNKDCHLRGRMHQLSTSGGVLQIPDALEQAANVRLIFNVGKTSFQTQAEMLTPMWSTRGCLQPFRFVGLRDEQRDRLGEHLQNLLRGPSAGGAADPESLS